MKLSTYIEIISESIYQYMLNNVTLLQIFGHIFLDTRSQFNLHVHFKLKQEN